MNLKRVLVLGSTGMLGHQVTNYFLSTKKYSVFNASYKNKLNQDTILIDALNNKALEELIQNIKPNIIINCIGVLIGGSNDIENAIYINAYLPHRLKSIVKLLDCRIIHISTDCVFSGDNGNYLEHHSPDGKGTYAQTKIMGEIQDNQNTTIRTSIIGPEIKINGEGLFHWFLNQRNKINGYSKEIWSGVTTIELAKAIDCIIQENIVGLYHVTNNKSISKNELLTLFNIHTDKKLRVIPVDGKKSNKSLIDSRKLLTYKIPSYNQMVFDMVELTKKQSHLYPYTNFQ
jgi:dTDP-4-dehydrorhamnose reductase